MHVVTLNPLSESFYRVVGAQLKKDFKPVKFSS